ncbi:MscS Mechanosensitive ion channel [Halothece sp. PCC 7418]|uniref:mechanosensitive ion channel domain-containing protein n=1 Tax=Halothece sp. (strain PCC 7418) TaxID=65093 RepID=UPI0002A060ED|nr:mechanosensitive ion channel domain-containing protein [Halothece sp. PCC 7418]AFZ45513.1 MscS Mechanosensitive ion channel [Halothece sp. PCC 7418]
MDAIPFKLIGQIILVIVASLGVTILLKRFLRNKLLPKIGISLGTREAVSIVISYSTGAFVFISILQASGINLSSFTVLAGGIGIGIGFGLQEVAKNFTSGLTLLFEQKIKAGDFVEWNGMTGYIDEVSLRSTVIRTIIGRYIIVPNRFLVENQVINWTYQKTKGWAMVEVSVAHESDTVLVVEILLDSAYMEETVSYEKPASVYFTGFGDNSLNFQLWVWVEEVDKKHITESSLRFIIEYNLRQYGIKLATPRLGVWYPSSFPTDLTNAHPQAPSSHGGVQMTPDQETRENSPLEIKEEETHPTEFPHLSKTVTPSRPLVLRDLLRKVSYFQNCSEIELKKLIEIGYRKGIKAGDILYREGDPGDIFYIILSGSVEYYVEKLNQVPTVLNPGEFVGELSLMLGLRRTVTVRAREETTLFAINKEGFETLLKEQPHLYELIVVELGRAQEELSQQQQQLRELGLLNYQELDKNPVAWVQRQLEKLFNR